MEAQPSVYQRARRGSKAVIVWQATGVRHDTWFWGWHPPPGAFLLLEGSRGYGPHNRNPNVLYVQPDQVHAVVDASAPAAWQRHASRRAARGQVRQ